MSKSAVAVVAAASRACLRERPMSWSLGRVLEDSTAALTPGEGGPPDTTETSEGDTRRSDLPEGVAANWHTAKTTLSESKERSHRCDKHRRRRWDAQLTVAEGVVLREA